MKKLFFLCVLALTGICAAAQEKEDVTESGDMDGGGYTNIFYNYNIGVPHGMSSHGWGIDLSGMEFRWAPGNGHNIFSVSVVDLSFDIHYMERGHMLALSDDQGKIIPAGEGKSRLVSSINDFGVTLPLGYTYEASRWAAGIYVAPGVSFAEFRNSYLQDGWRHYDSFERDEARVSFRLDIKAGFWFDDFGIMLRYRPFPAFRTDIFPSYNTVSVGVSFRM